MPMYTYQVVTEDGESGEIFEIFQRMDEPTLTKHPETGEPIQKVIRPPNVATRYTEGMNKKKFSDKNLDRLGFTKYQNEGGGIFRKTAGTGPEIINRGDG